MASAQTRAAAPVARDGRRSGSKNDAGHDTTTRVPSPAEAMLGGLLARPDPALACKALGMARPDDLAQPDLARIARETLALAERGELPDAVTVGAALTGDDALALRARLGELLDCADMADTPERILRFARAVRRAAKVRRERLLAARVVELPEDDARREAARAELARIDVEQEAEGAAEWPPLAPLRGSRTLPRISAELLPGWAGEFASELAVATETPEELPLAMVLGAVSAAVARRYRVEIRDGYSEPCNTWTLTALPPGSRKSEVQRRATEPVIAWEREQADRMRPEIMRARSARATAEARAKALRAKAASKGDERAAQQAADIEAELPEVPVAPVVWTSDATPERLGVLLAEQGEAIAVLSSEGGVIDTLAGRYTSGAPNLDLLLKAWSGDAERVDRIGRPSIHLRHPRVTLALSPQPSVIEGMAAQPGFRGRGLLGRFLYILPPSGIGNRTLETAPMSSRVVAGYALGLRHLLDVEPARDEQGREVLRTLRLAREAYTDWLAFARAVERMMGPFERLERMTDWGSKLGGGVARIAGVLHAVEHADGRPDAVPIARATMERAIAIGAALLEHAVAAYEQMDVDPEADEAARVWRWIERQRAASTTVREVHQALRSLGPVEEAEAALRQLERRGYLRVERPARRGPGRPPSPTVTVRPEIVEAWR